MKLIYYTSQGEIIDFKQLKDRYYDLGFYQQVISFDEKRLNAPLPTFFTPTGLTLLYPVLLGG